MTAYTPAVPGRLTPWWLILIDGIAVLTIGLLFLAAPGQTTLLTVQILGLYWLVSGILKIVGLFLDRTMWGWKLLGGLVGILGGLLVLQHPLWSSMVAGSTLVITLGVVGIAFGVIGMVQAVTGGGWGTGIMGAISILMGMALLANLVDATLSLPWIIGVLAVAGGISTIFAAIRRR